MKFLLTITIILVSTVTFLYYLLNNQNFLPIDSFGNYDWFNIATFVVLIFLAIFSLLSILIYLIFLLTKKTERKRTIIIFSIKYSLMIVIGLLVVFILNFFNILNLIWGVSILVVVLILNFII